MHQRGVLAAGGGTFTDTWHIVMSVITVLLMFLTIGFGAAALSKRFRYYSVATILVFIVFGVLTFAESPNIDKNLPTPFIGLWERINIAAFMVWMLVFAYILLRNEKKSSLPIQVQAGSKISDKRIFNTQGSAIKETV
jgi:accessory gene regulator protein AgrB